MHKKLKLFCYLRKYSIINLVKPMNNNHPAARYNAKSVRVNTYQVGLETKDIKLKN